MDMPHRGNNASERKSQEPQDDELTAEQLAKLRRTIELLDGGRMKSIPFDEVMREILSRFKPTFGDVEVFRTTADRLASLVMPAQSKEFFAVGGFPAAEVLGIDFSPAKTLPTVADYCSTRGYPLTAEGWDSSLCIGDNSGLLKVAESKSWHVYEIDPEGQRPPLFVNSSIELFGACLAAYATLCRPREDVSREVLAKAFEQTLVALDPPCDSGWWSSVVQEVEFGLS